MPDSQTIASYACGKHMFCFIRRIDEEVSLSSDLFAVYMLLTGSLQVTMGKELFIAHADDVFSLEAQTPCSCLGTDCAVVSIAFDQHFFERTLPVPRHPDFLCNSALFGNDASYDELRRLIARIVKNNADGQLGYELRNWSLIYSLMDAMYLNFKVEDSEARHRNAHRYTERMAQISAIIHKDFQSNLTLSELASRVHLSAPYLSKFIEKQFGMTFLNYLQRVRLNHATNELLKTDSTIETISANAGFPNSYAFVQAFKKEYGLLPSLYRKQAEEKPKTAAAIRPIEQHDYMSGLKKYLEKQGEDTAMQTVSCRATVGIVSNTDHNLESHGKAGRRRWLGRRPRNRGVVMNPVDHPMGGGEGRASGGHPRSRKGLPAKGYKTRNPKKNSNKLIIERRHK